MQLIERASFLVSMQKVFQNVDEGEGHCIFVSGEAGIGKTSLVKEFCNSIKNNVNIYQGTCDALFSPRPLAPLYDILLQLWNNLPQYTNDIGDRTKLFTEFFFEIKNKKKTSVIVFEDIHWADEATLDFIKFFARRIVQLHCLFILTYRDNEIYPAHLLRHVLGQLNTDSFSRLQLSPLSKEAVEKLAEEKGYRGEDVYNITGGNPFYVNEILASYSVGVPDNIKDSVLSSYNRLDDDTKHVWQVLSVLPNGFEIKYLEKIEPSYAASIHNCLDLKILIPKENFIFFKHELFRRTIENSLSPFLRVALNKKILELFKESFEQNKQIERIIHHAKNANEYETVVQYAPLAAKHASSVGAHIEASKLYLTAIEYFRGEDKNVLIEFYQSYAYECYLINRIKDAVIYASKALEVLKQKNDPEKACNCMRFLSRVYWIDGNRKNAEAYAVNAINVLADLPASKSKAMAFSNMSQLKMLSDEHDECIALGEKAIAMAKELGDEETLAHALNNVGTTRMRILSSRQEGMQLLQESLDIAIKNSYEEHAARAYTNFGSNAVEMKDYALAQKKIEEGIQYCEERDLDSWRTYLLAYKARMLLETGNWNEAYAITDNLIKNEDLRPTAKIGALVIAATIKMRRGEKDFLPLLYEARTKALETREAQRIIPVLVALMEYEWLTGTSVIKKDELDVALTLLEHTGNVFENSGFDFWLFKARKQHVALSESDEACNIHDRKKALNAAALWKQRNCPYEEAHALFEGDEPDKKAAIEIMHNLGANAVYEKMKFEMRASGIKSIPRGMRKSTKSNPANLTERELGILQLLREGLQNKEIGERLYISPKTVDHHISNIFFKLDVNSRTKAVQEATRRAIIK